MLCAVRDQYQFIHDDQPHLRSLPTMGLNKKL